LIRDSFHSNHKRNNPTIESERSMTLQWTRPNSNTLILHVPAARISTRSFYLNRTVALFASGLICIALWFGFQIQANVDGFTELTESISSRFDMKQVVLFFFSKMVPLCFLFYLSAIFGYASMHLMKYQ
jgi:hypothetical protein